ncbi:Adult-specific rigid cuticular protein 15.7 [Araneus ventricosus]|uniref:Adult-specific rigid cuticular protein 15.7 n=1 Tax=Araneus ventricosus TaxID=182803 RepID=A0A4Y2Q4B2_ARAVE|nr:Adult-specific rigid cuticular protein 15.7 [Araneus ventricosus]
MFVKVAFFCTALVAAHASLLAAPIISTGVSNRAQTQDAWGNYAFNYGIQDGLGATNSRAEVGDAAGNKKGSYTLADIDGRARRVDYVADGLGFRASVKTNEPGTAASAPAAALINSPYAGPVAPVVNHVAPAAAIAAPAIAAPLALGGIIGAGPIGLGHGAGLLGLGLGKVLI